MKHKLQIIFGDQEIKMPYVDPRKRQEDRFEARHEGATWGLSYSDVHISMFNRIKELEAEAEVSKGIIDGKISVANTDMAKEIYSLKQKLAEAERKNTHISSPKLIPFNLERALAGDPVIMKDGKSVKIAGHNPDANGPHKLIGWFDGCSFSWCEDGRYIEGQNHAPHAYDLFMAPKTRTVWVNLYETGQATHHDSEHEADGCSRNAVHTTSLGLKNLIRLGGKAYPIEITE